MREDNDWIRIAMLIRRPNRHETGSPPHAALSPKAQRATFLSQLDIYLQAMYPKMPT